MCNLSNFLSLLRLPLAIVFLIPDPFVRVFVVVTAMITDIGDGFLARRYQSTSRFGAVLDPIMDKFFVYFVFGILLTEHTLKGWQVAAMLSRDFSLILFTLYLLLKGMWRTYIPHSLTSGKVTTALQFSVLLMLSLQKTIWPYFYCLFIPLGGLFLAELVFTLKTIPRKP